MSEKPEGISRRSFLAGTSGAALAVAGTSYLTALTISEGAAVVAPNGKTLTMTVNGVKTKVAPGIYKVTLVMAVS